MLQVSDEDQRHQNGRVYARVVENFVTSREDWRRSRDDLMEGDKKNCYEIGQGGFVHITTVLQ